MTFTLTATKREEKGKKLKKLRESGVLPAVVYGPKDEATPMSLKMSDFEKLYRDAGESTIIDLKGLGDDKEVLIHDVAYDPVLSTPIHVDFYAIERGKKLQLGVAIEYIGEAPISKKGGVITKVIHEIEVECLPRNLPQHIEVDISDITEFDQQIQIKDLVLPEGIDVLNDPEDVIVVSSEVVEEVEEVPEEVDMDAIEVEHKGKEEESEGGEDKKEEEGE